MESQSDSSDIRFHLFNCDKTFNLDSVAELLDSVKAELPFKLSVEQHPFPLPRMRDLSEEVSSFNMDYAIFVVHAHESRLSINEENAGIGYAVLFKALLRATANSVLVVIGGDDNYKDRDEEETRVLSRWAKRKIMSQFTEDFFDGSTSFIFSWEKKHRPIHEEALLHLLLPGNKGKKFEPKPRPLEESGGEIVEPEPAVIPTLPYEEGARDGTGNGSMTSRKPYGARENGQEDETGESMEGEKQRDSEPENEQPAIGGGPCQKTFTFRATLQNGEVTATEKPDFHIPEAIAKNWKEEWENFPSVTAEIQVVNNQVKEVKVWETWSQWLHRRCSIL